MTNFSQNSDFQEAVLLADYAIKTALVEVAVLDDESIQTIQATPICGSDTLSLMKYIEAAVKSLTQAKEITKSLINVNNEVRL